MIIFSEHFCVPVKDISVGFHARAHVTLLLSRTRRAHSRLSLSTYTVYTWYVYMIHDQHPRAVARGCAKERVQREVGGRESLAARHQTSHINSGTVDLVRAKQPCSQALRREVVAFRALELRDTQPLDERGSRATRRCQHHAEHGVLNSSSLEHDRTRSRRTRDNGILDAADLLHGLGSRQRQGRGRYRRDDQGEKEAGHHAHQGAKKLARQQRALERRCPARDALRSRQTELQGVPAAAGHPATASALFKLLDFLSLWVGPIPCQPAGPGERAANRA